MKMEPSTVLRINLDFVVRLVGTGSNSCAIWYIKVSLQIPIFTFLIICLKMRSLSDLCSNWIERQA